MRLLACPHCGWTIAIRDGFRAVFLRTCYLCNTRHRFVEVV